MKAARLVSEIVILSARSAPITAAQLAQRLEVDRRTIYRDLVDLSRMGVPIIAESGPGGGISLLGTWTSPLSGLTRDELDSVLIGSLAATELGLSRELATARSKILAEADARLAGRILVDGPDWFMTSERPRALSTIVTALRSGRGLRLRYHGSRGPRERSLIPLGLVVKAGRWYLVGQPPGGRPRTYRVSRIESVVERFVSVSPPPGLSLDEVWRRSQVDFERAIRTRTALLRLPVTSLEDLRRAFPGRVTEEALDAARTGRQTVDVELPVEADEIAVAGLLTVDGVEVLAPRSLRALLARRAGELARRNAQVPAGEQQERLRGSCSCR
ncbi:MULTISPECIES: helix-turn-helix transcriptional regulator [Brevibacterium]|uniref:helix-turn-helix transcriptional regulator n=1 Tax=Brevibacterium TaxID=1696 RepID=UPI000DEB70EB|nr:MULTISPECIES: WYL domain-containing protein [Brevibacterium]